MKKLICILLLLALGAGCALAEVGRPFTLWFDGEFSLELPEGWASYPVSAVDARAGIQYALGNETGERCLYIQRQKVDGIRNAEALQAAIEAREDCSKVQPLELNGQAFASFILPGENVSGCATVLHGDVLTFLFQPQDESDYIMLVAEIMGSFKAA